MQGDLEHALRRWVQAGAIDRAAADRIRTVESGAERPTRLRWPVIAALVGGAVALGAGVLLLAASKWDLVSPGVRFALVALLTTVFHLAGAVVTERFPALATTLHAVGTAALGAGIFLAGLIFQLDSGLAGAILLWAVGAALAWAILRDWPQAVYTAVLLPFWLVLELTERLPGVRLAETVALGGLLLLGLVYLAASAPRALDPVRRALTWTGAVSVVPLALLLGLNAGPQANQVSMPVEPRWLLATAAALAFLVPMIVTVLLRGTAGWPAVVAALWVLAGIALQGLPPEAAYVWGAVGAIGLAAWGVLDGSHLRVNLGVVGLGLTILVFYSSNLMTRLGRSFSLIGLGVLLLAGGWLLERARRHLLAAVER